MANYYVYANGTQSGPFSTEELKLKRIGPDTLVWCDGMDGWSKAAGVSALKEVLATIPPPLPGSPPYTPPNPSPRYKASPVNDFFRNNWLALVAGAVVLLIVATAYSNYSQRKETDQREREANIAATAQAETERRLLEEQEAAKLAELKRLDAKKARDKENILKLVTVKDLGYEVRTFGGLHNIQVTVENGSDYFVEAAVVQVEVYKQNHGYHNSVTATVRNIPPGGTAWVRAPNIERGAYARGSVHVVKCAALEL